MTRPGGSLFAAFRRVVPDCITQSQAIAFNMFFVFFPMMLLVLGVVVTSSPLREGLLDAVRRLGPALPPGTRQVLGQVLSRSEEGALGWISVGSVVTLLAGTQMMRLMIEGLRMVYGDHERAGFWSRNVRALLLLLATIAPWFLAASLIVFGSQVSGWMIRRSGMPIVIGVLWSAIYVGAELVLAMMVLAFVYRVGRPRTGSWKAVMPGAALATVLWWLVSTAFGYYMRRVPYAALYGGLAAAIGLMLWMQLTAVVVLLGAAYNAQRTGSR